MELSVIIPVYNKAEYINDCIESLLKQDFNNFEIVAIDDGSTDESGDLCDKWAEKDQRIQVIHKENGGVTAARRMGVESAKGEYIVFVDADDKLLPNALRILYQAITNNNADEVIARFQTMTGNRSPIVFEGEIKDLKPLLKAIIEWRNHFPILWAVIYRKSILDDCLLTPREIIEGEDLLMQIQILMKRPKVYFIKDCVYAYNVGLPNNRKHTLELARLYDDILRKSIASQWEELRNSFTLHQIKEYEIFLLKKQYYVRNDYYQQALGRFPSGISLFHRIIWHLPPIIAQKVVWFYKRFFLTKQGGI